MLGNPRNSAALLTSLCATILLSASAAAAFGQERGPGDQNRSSAYICMMRVGPDPGGASITRIKVPLEEEQWLTSRGFRRIGCGTKAEKWLRTMGPSMCAVTDITDPTFLSDFRNWHGLSPAEICSLSSKLPAA